MHAFFCYFWPCPCTVGRHWQEPGDPAPGVTRREQGSRGSTQQAQCLPPALPGSTPAHLFSSVDCLWAKPQTKHGLWRRRFHFPRAIHTYECSPFPSSVLQSCSWSLWAAEGIKPTGKAKLDGGLSNLVSGSCRLQGGLELDILKGPFQPKPFYDCKTFQWMCFCCLSNFFQQARCCPSAPSGSSRTNPSCYKMSPTLPCSFLSTVELVVKHGLVLGTIS